MRCCRFLKTRSDHWKILLLLITIYEGSRKEKETDCQRTIMNMSKFSRISDSSLALGDEYWSEAMSYEEIQIHDRIVSDGGSFSTVRR